MELFLNASPWIVRHTGLIPGSNSDARPARPARVLDLACGSGRHVRCLTALGAQVTAVDRDAAALDTLRGVAAEVIVADLEAGTWPLDGQTFDAVIVTNYLWRPLLPRIVASVAPGGLLLYETFAHGNASVGKPSRPDFLLQPGELLDAVRPVLRVIAYEDGFLDAPPRFVQRIAAVRPAPADASAKPVRWPLHAS